MDDDRLDRRLRSDATGDRPHDVGLFLDRLATSQRARPVRFGRASARPSLGLATAVVLALVATLALRPVLFGPGDASPTPGSSAPGPSSSTRPAIAIEALDGVLAAWSSANGNASGSLSVIDRFGEHITIGFGSRRGNTTPAAGRIGEVGRMTVVSATLIYADCFASGSIGCILPTPGRLALHDPLRRWFPKSTIADRTVTQLLEGTSGVAPTGPTLADLARQIAAAPDRAWTRNAVLQASLEAPPRFEAGARREPVDTEYLILEELIGLASGEHPIDWIAPPVLGHGGLEHTWFGTEVPEPLLPGHAEGTVVADLDPRLIDLLGPAGGAAATSEDVARLAMISWGTAMVLPLDPFHAITDVDNGHREPLGAVGSCPCDADGASVITLSGHAIGWGSLAAWDYTSQAAVGVVVDVDPSQAGLDELLQQLIAVIRDDRGNS